MTITAEDFEELEISISRSSRTEGSENFTIFTGSSNQDVILDTTHSAAGRIIVEYPSESYVSATLILAGDWEPEAIEKLIQQYEDIHMPVTGVGSEPRHGQFGISVYTNVDEILFDLHNLDRLTPKPDKLDRIHDELSVTQRKIEEMPETINTALDELLAEQYDEIEDIVDSVTDSEDKKRQLQKRLRVGLERGLPTAVYEMSNESG